jgi:hypothetical protein
MEAFGNLNFSGVAKNLLAKLKAKDISLDEFLRECAYWAFKDGFDDLRVRPLPSRPRTQAFNEYENLTPDKKLKVDPQFFIKNPEINEYYSQASLVKNYNRANYDWLKKLKSYLPKEDEACLLKINTRLQDFINFFNEENDFAERAKEVFSAEEA